MSNSNSNSIERTRQDMSSSPIQPSARLHQNASVGKENCVKKYDDRLQPSQRFLLKNTNSTDAKSLSSKSMLSGQLGQKRRLSDITTSSAMVPQQTTTTTTTTQGAVRTDFYRDSSPVPLHIQDDYSRHMEEERRRHCSDPVAAFLNRQFHDEDHHYQDNKLMVPLQVWGNRNHNWQVSAINQQILRPKPVRPTAMLP
ncbi:unnamed protein product [Cylindrotheca closterium]|uniref:Uncharacterized protein n=1 Tax=Cylindrotheca closterium TaxID=2856 RepID=A0AAD2FNJ5_9STRA|nr:unnamed protein product [Cylindrotheca closterium]